MVVDASILLTARDLDCRAGGRAAAWLEESLNGATRIGLPWESLTAFLRISTHARASAVPLRPAEALAQIRAWIAAPAAWIPTPTGAHSGVLESLIERYELRGNLIPDAHLAALAICYGVPVCSADTDFARFEELRWVNPLAGS